jgi:NitT/TauT family transport system permease protein
MSEAKLVVPEPKARRAVRSAWLSETLAPRLAVGLAILLAWEILVRLAAPAYVAKPSGIALALPKVVVDPAFWAATGATLAAVAQGLLLAIAIGTVLGLMIGRSVVADRMLRHYVNGFYAVPMVVVLPLVSLWFGYTGAARLATIVFAALFAIILNVADGARAVPREFIEVSRSFRAGRVATLFEVVLPSATPYFLAGLRLAAGRALIGAVVAEFFTAIGGLGYFILYHSRTFKHSEAFVGVLLLAGFGVGRELLLNWGIRRFLPWYRRDDRG